MTQKTANKQSLCTYHNKKKDNLVQYIPMQQFAKFY